MERKRNEKIETALFHENINLIRKIAWRFHNSTGIEWEELFEEASYAFVLSLRTYKPKKSKLSTYTYTYITNHLIDFTKKYNNISPSSDILDKDMIACPKSETTISFFDTLNSLSEEGQYVCKMVLTSPSEFAEESKRLARRHIIDQLRKEGWSWPKIWRCFREIKSALN